jgi:hypothetical protein
MSKKAALFEEPFFWEGRPLCRPILSLLNCRLAESQIAYSFREPDRLGNRSFACLSAMLRWIAVTAKPRAKVREGTQRKGIQIANRPRWNCASSNIQESCAFFGVRHEHFWAENPGPWGGRLE